MTALLQRPDAPAPVAAGLSAGRRTTAWVAAGLAVLGFWVVAYGLVLSAAQEHSAQRRLYATFRERLAAGEAPTGAAASGTPVALLTLPSLGRQQVVVEGTTSHDLQDGPGHLRSTVLPGQAGQSIVFGKATTFGAPFADVPRLRAGDPVTVTTGQGVFRYRVEGTRRAGDPLPPTLSVGSGRLTLATLEGDGWRAGWAPQRVVYVDAALQGKAAPAAPVRVVVSRSELAGRTDPSGLVMVVLWLQLLVVVVVAVVWAAVRWGVWQAWVAGVPALLALLWAATGAALPLLPNLL